MTIANPVLTTAVTLGATVTSLTKVSDGFYAYTNPTGNIPTTLAIKPAAINSTRAAIRLTIKRNPGIYDAASAVKSGNMSATFELAATKGSVVTVAVLEDFLEEFASLLATPALIQALLNGSVE